MIYAKIAAALVLVLALVGAYIKGRSDGGAIVRSEYAQRDLKAAQDYAQKEREITDAYRKKEASWASASAAVSKKYQKELANVHTQRLADLAAIDAGTLRLRDPIADSEACGDSATEAAARAVRNYDHARADIQAAPAGMVLSKASSKFLIDLAAEADERVMQLTACQQILIDERK